MRSAALAALLIATPAWAQQTDDTAAVDNTAALAVAHRTAIRRLQQGRAAKRELTLQYACHTSTSTACSGDSNPAQCALDLVQACAALKAAADNCVANAAAYCASAADPDTCETRRTALCPSYDRQPIALLLAKYPLLSAAQKGQLRTLAATLEAEDGGWWSDFTAWIGTAL